MELFRTANCPGFSGTVPDFGAVPDVPEKLKCCPGF